MKAWCFPLGCSQEGIESVTKMLVVMSVEACVNGVHHGRSNATGNTPKSQSAFMARALESLFLFYQNDCNMRWQNVHEMLDDYDLHIAIFNHVEELLSELRGFSVANGTHVKHS